MIINFNLALKTNYLSFFFSPKVLLVLFCLICVTGTSYAELPNDSTLMYADTNFLRYDDHVYDSKIKTVQLYNSKSSMSYPIISIDGTDKLKINFDVLGNELRYFNFTFIHCNANWQPSDLLPKQFISGNFEDEIKQYSYSLSSGLQYINYSAEFPNENIAPIVSGNYILKVYTNFNSDDVVITKRFMVVNNKVKIYPTVKEATNVLERFSRQEIDFSIDYQNTSILNPYDNFKVVLMQNYRWDNAITGLVPRFINGTTLDYNYETDNVFDGGNEFRNFDIKSLRSQTINIKRIMYNEKDKLIHVYLIDDENRSYKRYITSPDLNGNFLIKKDESLTDSDIEAAYVKVHFSLKQYPELKEGNVYIVGKFSDWKFNEEFKMKYDTLNNVYEQEVLLKQGYYNYMYCVVKDGSKNVGDMTQYEGSFFETENDYSILTYYRNPILFYDELIGYRTFNSIKRN